MLETYSKQQLQTLVGYEVKDSAGEKVGYVDALLTPDGTAGMDRYLERSSQRAPLPRAASGHDARGRLGSRSLDQGADPVRSDGRRAGHRGLVIGKGDHFAISGEQEETAYRHYGLEPPRERADGYARLRVWVYEVRAERIRV